MDELAIRRLNGDFGSPAEGECYNCWYVRLRKKKDYCSKECENKQNTDTEIVEYQKEVKGITYFVYQGLCNGTETKWITKSPWDYSITLNFIDDDRQGNDISCQYLDGNGDAMLVYEVDEAEYYKF